MRFKLIRSFIPLIFQSLDAQPYPGYEMPTFSSNAPPPCNRNLTPAEISAMDTKLATIREAFSMILQFRNRNPQPEVLNLPDVQRLYRMIVPIVRAAERVEARSNIRLNAGLVLPNTAPLTDLNDQGAPAQSSPVFVPQSPQPQPQPQPQQQSPFYYPNQAPPPQAQPQPQYPYPYY